MARGEDLSLKAARGQKRVRSVPTRAERAGGIIDVGVVHVRRVSVRGRPEEHETVTRMEVESRELAASLDHSVVEVEGRVEAADFFHESREEIGTLAKEASGLGVLREVPHHAADERRRRFASGCEHRRGDTERCVTGDTSVLTAAASG